MNTRLFGVLQRLWAYRVRVKADLMGLAYQELRASSETAILGAYFTPPDLTEFAIEALLAYLADPAVMLNRDALLEGRRGEHPVIDVTCGSGTFLVSLAAKAIESTRRAHRDTSTARIRFRCEACGG
jgi:type I restriction-modification system DNA methylase subunit